MPENNRLHVVPFRDGQAVWRGKIDRVLFWPFILTPRERKGVLEGDRLMLWWLGVKKLCCCMRWRFGCLMYKYVTKRWRPYWGIYRLLSPEERADIIEIGKDLRYPFEVEQQEEVK